MNRIFLILLLYVFSLNSRAQGYFGKKFYVSAEVLHLATGIPGFQLGGGLLKNRYYALELQLNYCTKRMDLYGVYEINLGPQSVDDRYGQNEYLLGKAKFQGFGGRLTYRSFNRASHKAAPIGWYLNYSVDYLRFNVGCNMELKTPEGFTKGAGKFIVRSSTQRFEGAISFYSILLTPGKTFSLTESLFLDIGLDIGLRFCSMEDLDWRINNQRIYTLETLFKYNDYEEYLKVSGHKYFENGKVETIYKPVLKIGYLF